MKGLEPRCSTKYLRPGHCCIFPQVVVWSREVVRLELWFGPNWLWHAQRKTVLLWGCSFITNETHIAFSVSHVSSMIPYGLSCCCHTVRVWRYEVNVNRSSDQRVLYRSLWLLIAVSFEIFHEPLSEMHHLGLPGSWICLSIIIIVSINPSVHLSFHPSVQMFIHVVLQQQRCWLPLADASACTVYIEWKPWTLLIDLSTSDF